MDSKVQDDPVVVSIGKYYQLYENTLRPPFRFLDTFREPISIPCFLNNRDHLIGLIVALKYSKKIPKLIFDAYSWQQDELFLLEESLANNQGIKEIEFARIKFTLNFTESIVRILKRNKNIKKVVFNLARITVDPWARFCDGMEYYNFTKLDIQGVELKENHVAAFCEGISFNQTIRSVRFFREELPGRSLEHLSAMLEFNRSIEKVKFVSSFSEATDFREFNRALNSNYFLKSLAFRESHVSARSMNAISTALQNNKSITKLTISDPNFGCTILGNILLNNKTIRTLDLSGNITAIDNNNISELKLRDNKTLTELSIHDCRQLSLSAILKELGNNTTLKILRIGDNRVYTDQPAALERIVRTTTLQEFYIKNTRFFIDLEVYAMDLGSVLRFNKTLRKLEVNLEHLRGSALKKFLEALKSNTTLTWLDIGYFGQREYDLEQDPSKELDWIADLLETNKTLRYITGAERLAGLRSNRKEQDLIMDNTCGLIKMILCKPNSFILPIEVWANIFKYVSFTFVPFDFEKFFHDSMAR